MDPSQPSVEQQQGLLLLDTAPPAEVADRAERFMKVVAARLFCQRPDVLNFQSLFESLAYAMATLVCVRDGARNPAEELQLAVRFASVLDQLGGLTPAGDAQIETRLRALMARGRDPLFSYERIAELGGGLCTYLGGAFDEGVSRGVEVVAGALREYSSH